MINPPDETTAINNPLASKKLNVNLYPNPTAGVINLKLNNGLGKHCFIEIFDARGIKVGEKSYPRLEQDVLNFDLQKFDRGIYWISIQLDDFDQIMKRFIIVK